jgi:hypothetical protein
MSRYEMLNYDNLLTRVGIQPGSTWFCGANQAENPVYDQPDATYDQMGAGYSGNTQGHAALCLTEDINVNGLLLNHRDANGTIWLCTGIEGWWTTAAPDIADVPAPYWDGSMLTTGRYTTRTITISGCFIPPDSSLVWYNRDAILRAASIVRGVGLLAMCGNESPMISRNDPFYDPPKMAVIQMADVPLIDTTKTSGFTEFSMSFRCSYPTKLSVYEKSITLTPADSNVKLTREYAAFSRPYNPADPGDVTTSYEDLLEIEGSGEITTRKYGAVKEVNADALIANEELVEENPDMGAYQSTTGGTDLFPSTSVRNAGNYFAFPIFVFGEIKATGTVSVKVRNITTNEEMTIRKTVPKDWQLVIDTGLRRVALVDPGPSVSRWVWDDRSSLTLTSQWISLAPGFNKITVVKGSGISFPGVAPQIFYRDTWIG